MKPRTRRPNPAAHTGFTLIELLVVMAIIGVLISLLLPAVQSARSAARRTQCLNNMMQVGLGLQNYESAWERFPSGVTNPTGPIVNQPTGYHMSWIAQFLPFFEQTSTFNHINFSLSAYADENQTVRKVAIRTLVCPGDPQQSFGSGIAQASYAGNHHHTEAPIDVSNTGVLFLNSAVRTEDIEDGAGNTVAFGEKPIDLSEFGWLSGTRSTLRNGGTDLLGKGTGGGPPPAVADPVGGFRSYHTGGANFAFADGHVSFMKATVGINLLQRLLNRSDGELLLETQ